MGFEADLDTVARDQELPSRDTIGGADSGRRGGYGEGRNGLEGFQSGGKSPPRRRLRASSVVSSLRNLLTDSLSRDASTESLQRRASASSSALDRVRRSSSATSDMAMMEMRLEAEALQAAQAAAAKRYAEAALELLSASEESNDDLTGTSIANPLSSSYTASANAAFAATKAHEGVTRKVQNAKHKHLHNPKGVPGDVLNSGGSSFDLMGFFDDDDDYYDAAQALVADVERDAGGVGGVGGGAGTGGDIGLFLSGAKASDLLAAGSSFVSTISSTRSVASSASASTLSGMWSDVEEPPPHTDHVLAGNEGSVRRTGGSGDGSGDGAGDGYEDLDGGRVGDNGSKRGGTTSRNNGQHSPVTPQRRPHRGGNKVRALKSSRSSVVSRSSTCSSTSAGSGSADGFGSRGMRASGRSTANAAAAMGSPRQQSRTRRTSAGAVRSSRHSIACLPSATSSSLSRNHHLTSRSGEGALSPVSPRRSNHRFASLAAGAVAVSSPAAKSSKAPGTVVARSRATTESSKTRMAYTSPLSPPPTTLQHTPRLRRGASMAVNSSSSKLSPSPSASSLSPSRRAQVSRASMSVRSTPVSPAASPSGRRQATNRRDVSTQRRSSTNGGGVDEGGLGTDNKRRQSTEASRVKPLSRSLSALPRITTTRMSSPTAVRLPTPSPPVSPGRLAVASPRALVSAKLPCRLVVVADALKLQSDANSAAASVSGSSRGAAIRGQHVIADELWPSTESLAFNIEDDGNAAGDGVGSVLTSKESATKGGRSQKERGKRGFLSKTRRGSAVQEPGKPRGNQGSDATEKHLRDADEADERGGAHSLQIPKQGGKADLAARGSFFFLPTRVHLQQAHNCKGGWADVVADDTSTPNFAFARQSFHSPRSPRPDDAAAAAAAQVVASPPPDVGRDGSAPQKARKRTGHRASAAARRSTTVAPLRRSSSMRTMSSGVGGGSGGKGQQQRTKKSAGAKNGQLTRTQLHHEPSSRKVFADTFHMLPSGPTPGVVSRAQGADVGDGLGKHKVEEGEPVRLALKLVGLAKVELALRRLGRERIEGAFLAWRLDAALA